jgi:hypothetical protein
MIIEVDFDLLHELKLTANQFLLAYLIYKQDYQTLTKFIADTDKELVSKDVKKLESKSYISNISSDGALEPSALVARNKLNSIFEEEKDTFEELTGIYPMKVLRPDGYNDYLRTDLKRCRKIYQGILGASKFRHKAIIRALKFELETRTREGTMKYMKRLPKWLAAEEWKVYEDRMNDKDNTNEPSSYGTTLN